MFTVGDLLQNARKKMDLTIEEVEKKTKIRSKYLRAMEKNDWNAFPSKVYITGIIRSYAKFLNVEYDKAMAYFRRDYEKRDEVKFKGKMRGINVLPETKKLVIVGISFIVVLFLAYFAYQFNLFLAPPKVAVIEPTQSVFRNREQLTVVGITQKESSIKIGNETLFPDSTGRFEYVLPLKKGRNTVKIEVTGANGKKSYVTKEYILE